MEDYICALCGEKIDAMDDDYEELADGKIVCVSCYLHKCKRCIGCNELFAEEEMIDLDVEGYCCRSCYNESMDTCAECGKSVSHFLMQLNNSCQYVCPDCYKPPENTGPKYTLQDLLREYREKREKQQNPG